MAETGAAAARLIVVVTGSSRGIGLEYCRQHLARGDQVLATCRSPDKATELQQLMDAHTGRGCAVVPLDVTSAASAAKAAELIGQHAPYVSVLINNAGVSNEKDPRDPIATADPDTINSVFDVNVTGVQRVMAALLPLLRKAPSPARVCNVSSSIGAITLADRVVPGCVSAYRLSKAALNMLTRTWACSGEPLIVVSVQPGAVDTDMGQGRRHMPGFSEAVIKGVDPAIVVAALIELADSLTPAHNGRNLSMGGGEAPW